MKEKLLKYKYLLTILIVMVIAICYREYQIHLYKEKVLELKYELIKDFRNPDTVKFRNITLQSYHFPFYKRLYYLLDYIDPIKSLFDSSEYTTKLCGEVNGMNAFGAYVGYKKFYISDDDDKYATIDDDENYFAETMCFEEDSPYILYKEEDN